MLSLTASRRAVAMATSLRRICTSSSTLAPRVAELPTVDLSPFLNEGESSGDLQREAADTLRKACEDWGAFYVTGHGIDAAGYDTALHRAKQFFDLPLPVKRGVGTPPAAAAGFVRGYIGMGEESGSDSLEVKEAFSYGYDWDPAKAPTNSLQGPNQWPSEEQLGKEWRSDMNTVFDNFVTASHGITQALSLAMGHDRDELMKHCSEGDTISLMRVFRYLPYSSADDEVHGAAAAAAEADSTGAGRIGSSPHTDWGWLTLILQQNDVVGLQVCKDGEWLDVPPKEGTLMVNIGDYVSLLTGGDLVSPLHRVVTGDAERTSFVFFPYPDYDAAVPVATDRKVSLFTDQRQGVAGELGAEELPFGEFIRRKWASVSRDV